MIRIAGINIPDNKRAVIGLTAVYGIGKSLSARILRELSISENVKVKDLTSAEEQKIREYIESKIKVEGELRREVTMNIKHHKDIGSWRGQRHSKHLPVRGQRTKTNSRTVRGNTRKTAGSGRRPSAEKT
ncbi:MAG: 30S ribosomal protein S13 [Candidatus Andersenbacteria bacterium]|nr:30S ribosomal protein S13 [Candidatus Andersenbacteria bacterium]MBI3250319.1 30S ribosomal protein S13 [Candidatus Andersenbacteria bacterium]